MSPGDSRPDISHFFAEVARTSSKGGNFNRDLVMKRRGLGVVGVNKALLLLVSKIDRAALTYWSQPESSGGILPYGVSKCAI